MLLAARRAPGSIAACVELHIEQGPVLEAMGRSAGVVIGTYGVERHMLRFTGQAAHSGSTPIPMRRDAFLAAAQTALQMNALGAVGVGAYGYYAPDIVTGVDAKRLWEAGARVELEVVRGTGYVYLGYRRMELRLDNDTDVTLDKGGHVGVRIAF